MSSHFAVRIEIIAVRRALGNGMNVPCALTLTLTPTPTLTLAPTPRTD